MQYRADIDGLRTVAVTSVVLFHAGLAPLTSGFVGVDVFFVISGFLIGGIVLREVEDRQFSFARFYARRARRILPALFAVLAFTALAGLFLLSPRELKSLGFEIATASVGVSNMYYWQSIDYFNPTAENNPLLMTWSLGVEEQFYAVFPLALIACRRLMPGRVLTAMAVVCAASFALSLYATYAFPTAAFYSLPPRAWELGLGVMLAMVAARRPLDQLVSPGVQQLAAAAGVLLVAGSMCAFDGRTPFPGWVALLPVAGTLLLIAAPKSWFNRTILASRPFVFVGKISYSWYLWHWPLMTFVRLSHATEPPLAAMLGAAAVSFGLAVASYYLVETPFRRTKLPAPRVLAAYGVALLAVLSVPTAFVVGRGLPARLSPGVERIEASQGDAAGEACLGRYGQVTPNLSEACAPAGDGRPAWALLGDSHAHALAPAFRHAAEAQDRRALVLTKSSCPALSGASRRAHLYPRHGDECVSFNQAVLDDVRGDPSIELVVVGGYWSAGADATSPYYAPGVAKSEDALRQGLADQVAVLEQAGKKVVVLSDSPRLAFDPLRELLVQEIPARRLLATLTDGPKILDGPWARPEFISAQTHYDVVARRTAVEAGAVFQDLHAGLCRDGRCRIVTGDMQPLYRDSQHLSAAGSFEALSQGLLSRPEVAAQDTGAPAAR